MTDKEKAEKEANNYKIDLCAYCRECGKGNCSHTDDAIFGFKDGYKIGLAEGRKEVYELYNTEVDDIAKDYAERLKKFEEELAEQKEKHESNKRALKLIIEKGKEVEKEKYELLDQIEKMKRCFNCSKWFSNTELCVSNERGTNICDKWELAE